MDLHLYNSLTRKKEKFTSINPPNVGLYTCGPTVYGPSHIGHARSYVSFDTFKRALLFNGYKVNHVMNITDVHDSIIERASELNVPINELSNKYTDILHRDLNRLNCIPANHYPKVTEHIEDIIKMIKLLVEKGFAYVEVDGSVYYKVEKFKDYGKLSGIKVGQGKAGTRVLTDKYEKDEASDFALWKTAKEGEQSWNSPWGKGRPGWHIECSVMSKKYLGDTFDIHTGGMDLKFPHHENEIAQSEAVNEKPFVNYFLHVGLLDVEGTKMSRSLGNVYSLKDLEDRGFTAMDFRYLTFLTHYRSKMNFSWQALEAAQTAYKRLKEFIDSVEASTSEVARSKAETTPRMVNGVEPYAEKFLLAINDDLNMPSALAQMWSMLKDDGLSSEDKVSLLLKWDEVLGLNVKSQKSKVKSKGQKSKVRIPKQIQEMVERREELRKQKKFKEADIVREEIEEKGFTLEDTPEGTNISKSS